MYVCQQVYKYSFEYKRSSLSWQPCLISYFFLFLTHDIVLQEINNLVSATEGLKTDITLEESDLAKEKRFVHRTMLKNNQRN